MSGKTLDYWNAHGFQVRAGERSPCRNRYGTPVFFRDQVIPKSIAYPKPKEIIFINGKYYREL